MSERAESKPAQRRSREGPGRFAILACGALAREVRLLIRERDWPADLYTVPARQHLYPQRIVRAVDRRLGELSEGYGRIVVVYGDCGTAGALDEVLARHEAVRPVGADCYEMLAGGDPLDLPGDGRATYLLTDFLIRAWDRLVLPSLGLDERPELRDAIFGGIERVVYLRQRPEPDLEAEARRIAAWLGGALEIRDTGRRSLEERLLQAVEGD